MSQVTAFGKLMAEALRQASFDVTIREDGMLDVRDGAVFGQINVRAMLRYYQTGHSLKWLVERAIRGIRLSNQRLSFETVRPHIVLSLLQEPAPEYNLLTYPCDLTGLGLVPTVDLPDYFISLTEVGIATWPVGREELFQIARANTFQALPDWQPGTFEGRRFWTIEGCASCGNAAIAFPEITDRIAVPRERLWLATPARSAGLACEGGPITEDEFILYFAMFVREKSRENPNSGSPWIYRRLPGGEVERVSAEIMPRISEPSGPVSLN